MNAPVACLYTTVPFLRCCSADSWHKVFFVHSLLTLDLIKNIKHFKTSSAQTISSWGRFQQHGLLHNVCTCQGFLFIYLRRSMWMSKILWETLPCSPASYIWIQNRIQCKLATKRFKPIASNPPSALDIWQQPPQGSNYEVKYSLSRWRGESVKRKELWWNMTDEKPCWHFTVVYICVFRPVRQYGAKGFSVRAWIHQTTNIVWDLCTFLRSLQSIYTCSHKRNMNLVPWLVTAGLWSLIRFSPGWVAVKQTNP